MYSDYMSVNLDLPSVPPLSRSLGPSFILLGLALGSGELILWPYLVATHGLGLIWGGLIGITFQYFLNTEVMRYSLAHGESVFVGWRRWGKLIPSWFIFSTVIPWALPGFAATSAAILHHILPVLSPEPTAIILLLLTGLIISSGKTLYQTMERVQTTLLLFGLPFIALLSLYLARGTDWLNLGRGLIGIGDGWMFFPEGIALGAFLGAFAYSGGGGNLNLAQSYYIKEKGFGMGKYATGIKALLRGKEAVRIDGQLFRLTPSNLGKWHKWWSLVTREHSLVFWGLGLTAILLLATLSASTSGNLESSGGLSFLFAESEAIALATNQLVGKLFLLVGALMLFTTQLGVLESATRINSENYLLLRHSPHSVVPSSRTFYTFLWIEIGLGIIFLLVGAAEPRALLTLGAVLNAAAMMVAFPLILALNLRLPEPLRPSYLRRWVITLAFAFFLFFVYQTIRTSL